MTLIQRTLHGWFSWRERKLFERSIRLTRRRIMGMSPDIADLSAKRDRTRALRKSTKAIDAELRKAMTGLLRAKS